jgi:hypothetical protein
MAVHRRLEHGAPLRVLASRRLPQAMNGKSRLQSRGSRHQQEGKDSPVNGTSAPVFRLMSDS